MSFELSNTLASFQDYINKILIENLDIFVFVYLDDIFIYTKNPGQGYIEAVRWILDILRKNVLFANLKKCRFHKNKMRFLSYVVLSQNIQMKDERIKVVRNWPKLKLAQDIQVFIGFINFYQYFIRDFSRLATSLTLILKTTQSSDLAPRKLRTNEVIRGGGKANNRNLSKESKNAKFSIQIYIRAMEEPIFLILDAKEIFNQLLLKLWSSDNLI